MTLKYLFLLGCLTFGLMAGCSDTSPRLTELKVDMAEGSTCATIQGASERARFMRTRTGFLYRAELPSSISQGESSHQVKGKIATNISDVEPLYNAELFQTVFIVLLIILLIVGFVFLGMLQGILQNGDWDFGLKGLAVVVILVLLTLGAAWLKGTKLTLDNATDMAMDVVVDDRTIALEPRSFAQLDTRGGVLTIQTKQGDKVIESLSVQSDPELGSTLRRLINHDRRFIYNVCGVNTYTIKNHLYY